MKVNDTDNIILALIICAPLFLLILGGMIIQLRDFSRELKYLNCEIGRTEGDERRQWIRRRRRLWLSLIPFIHY